MSWGDPKRHFDSILERIHQGKVKNVTIFSTFKLQESDWVTLFKSFLQSPSWITSIQISGHPLKGKAVVALQEYLLETKSLESLAVFPCAAADEDIQPLLAITRNPHTILSQLDLSGKSISGMAPNLVRLLSTLPTLRTLNVSGNKGINVDSFPSSLALEFLDISDCGLTVASLRAWLKACPNLATLKASHNPDLDDTLFTPPCSVPRLSMLVLESAGISEKSLDPICSLYPMLVSLDISQCLQLSWTKSFSCHSDSITTLKLKGINECSAFLERHLFHFKNLRHLDIAESALKGCKPLIACLKHPTIEYLLFRSNILVPFDIDSGAASNTSCKHIDLTSTNLELSGLRVLIQKYSNIESWEVADNPLCQDSEAIEDLVQDYPAIDIIWR